MIKFENQPGNIDIHLETLIVNIISLENNS